MKQQIVKLLKRQTRLKFDELLILSELEEDELEKILQKLISEEIIKKVGDKYVYRLPMISSTYDKMKNQKESKYQKYNAIKKDLKSFNTEAHKKEKVFKDEEEIEEFNAMPDYAKKFVLKYLTAMKAAGSLRGAALHLFLKNFAEHNPEYKVNYSSFMKARKDYLTSGISGLIPNYGNKNKCSIIKDEEYSAFRELYLTPDSRSVAGCLKLMKEKGVFGDRIIIPTEISFKRRLLKDFSVDEIKQIRTKHIFFSEEFMTEVNNTMPKKRGRKKKNITFMNCQNLIQASELFLKSDKFYSNPEARQKNIQSVLNKHLLPFFKDLNFKDITDETIEKFKIQKLSESYRPASISIFLNVMQEITSRYSKIQIKNYFIYLKVTEDFLILSTAEMAELLNKTKHTKLYLPLLLTLCLGLSLPEVKALTAEDIDLKANKISINKIFGNDRLQKYRTKYQIREITIPKSLRKILKNLKSKDFENFKNITDADLKGLLEKDMTFLELQNSYINNLIRNNIPLNLIAKQIGLANTNELVEKYGAFIDDKALAKFDFASQLTLKIND